MPQPLLTKSISFAGTGDNTVIPSQSNGKISIWRLVMTAAGTTAVIIKDGSTALTGAMTITTNQPVTLADGADVSPFFGPLGLGNAFVINQSGSVQISGVVEYTIQAY